MSNSSDDKIDSLTDKVDRWVKGRESSRADMAELKAMIREQNEVSKRQAETTDRLVKIVETLISK